MTPSDWNVVFSDAGLGHLPRELAPAWETPSHRNADAEAGAEAASSASGETAGTSAVDTIDAARMREGNLDVIDTDEALTAAIDRLRSGMGPVAIDAERASGFRYSDRAYLVQLYRRDGGTMLVDPTAFDDLTIIQEAIGDEEWIFHAATQDLPCLRDLGMVPSRIFDTELAARLLGMPRVGLGAVTLDVLGIELAKAHSADDWSVRPLPLPWLAYAALDVELLVDIRDALAKRLADAGKLAYAEQEFAAILDRPLIGRRDDPWRKFAGVRSRSLKHLAVARALWTARDELARERDVAPGRLVPDRSMAAVVQKIPATKAALASRKDFTGRESRREIDRWWAAIELGLADEHPPQPPATKSDMPSHRSWAKSYPKADAALTRIREVTAALADELQMPPEQLVSPEPLRRLAWFAAGEDADAPMDADAAAIAEVPVGPPSRAAIAEVLTASGARPWQVETVSAPIAAALGAQAHSGDAQQTVETVQLAGSDPVDSPTESTSTGESTGPNS